MKLTHFYFMFVDIIKQLISMLEVTEDYVGPQVLATLTYVGRKGIFLQFFNTQYVVIIIH